MLLAWLPTVLMLGGAVLLFAYIARGKRGILLAAMVCALAGVALIFAIPADIAGRINFQEFMDYRFSFLYRIYRPQTTEGRYAFAAAFKFVPIALSLGCATVSLVRDRGEH